MAIDHALPFHAQNQPQENLLLGALGADSIVRLRPHLKFVYLPLGKVLYEPGVEMQNVHFPTDSIISLLYVMYDGASTEISVVGNEGVLGVSLFMGGESLQSAMRDEAGSYHLQAPQDSGARPRTTGVPVL